MRDGVSVVAVTVDLTQKVGLNMFPFLASPPSTYRELISEAVAVVVVMVVVVVFVVVYIFVVFWLLLLWFLLLLWLLLLGFLLLWLLLL